MKIRKLLYLVPISVACAVAITNVPCLQYKHDSTSVTYAEAGTVTLTGKQTITYDDMLCIIETFSNGCVAINAQFNGDKTEKITDKNILELSVPFDMYVVEDKWSSYAGKGLNVNGEYYSSGFKQWDSYARKIENISGNMDIFTYKLSYDPYSYSVSAEGFTLKQGNVANFILFPISDNADITAIQVFGTELKNTDNTGFSATDEKDLRIQELEAEVERLKCQR